ncbi:MAG: universal stress protein UspA-like protein [Bacteroidetes bacterium]|nr:MAG: universal stress protein UspA-like protein [Bacteroidota bacterium]
MEFDLEKLKKRPSYPFETIAVAVAFSPRLEGVVGEAWRLSKVFGAKLLLMHIGDRTRNKEDKLNNLLEKLKVDEQQVRIIWNEGNAVDTLLQLCKLHVVDLLVLGALRKENMLNFYLGSLARNISRRAKCSVLLLTEPDPAGTRYKKIMVSGVENPKTIHTINTAIYFAEHVKAKEITVATEVHHPGLAMTAGDNTAPEASKMKKEMKEEELNKVHEMVESCRKHGDIEICEKVIQGKPGYAIRQYATSKKADLLVINSPEGKLGIFDRIFTHDMEYILEDLPCNVLIVHSRVTTE